MGYSLVSFDDLTLSDRLQTPDAQNMGTGQALSSYMQIPGGFFDHYGDLVAPKGIRPITKSGVLYGSTESEVAKQIDDLRLRIGKRARLVVRFDDGQIRWQWARLLTCDTPQPFEAVSRWVPFLLRWETADQYWRGNVYDEDTWIIGDDSFFLGDGSSYVGESGTASALTATGGAQSFTITQQGNITVEAVKVTITAGTNDITSANYKNNETNEVWTVDLPITSGQTIVVDGGTRSVYAAGADAFTNFYDNSSKWPTLIPGDNSITVTIAGNAAQDATIAWEYFDHYA